jgi:hypothetical protein
MAHTSRHHWGVVGQPVHWARGEWQISLVYATLGHCESALYHARKCVDYAERNGLGDFDRAAAYESMVRALRVGGKLEEARQQYELAWASSKRVVEPEDRAVIFADLREHAVDLGMISPDTITEP